MKDYIYIIFVIIFGIIGWFSTTGTKSQWIRILDILFYGPFLIWLALYKISDESLKIILILMGATTITYNARNFISTYSQNVSTSHPASW